MIVIILWSAYCMWVSGCNSLYTSITYGLKKTAFIKIFLFSACMLLLFPLYCEYASLLRSNQREYMSNLQWNLQTQWANLLLNIIWFFATLFNICIGGLLLLRSKDKKKTQHECVNEHIFFHIFQKFSIFSPENLFEDLTDIRIDFCYSVEVE